MRNFRKLPALVPRQDFMFFARKDRCLSNLLNLQHSLYLDFSFPSPSPEVQGSAIRFLLYPADNLRDHVLNTLTQSTKYYLINTEFWNTWKRYVGWEGKKGEMGKAELDVRVEKGYEVKLSNALVYPDNFEVVSEKMHRAFRRWHKAFLGKPVSRKVIRYREGKAPPYNPHELKTNDISLKINKGRNDVYELELSPYFFLVFKVKDNGEFPENPQYSFFSKIMGTKQAPTHSIELYISRYPSL